jgi:hypothetical protein
MKAKSMRSDPMYRDDFLMEAQEIINGNRATDYGDNLDTQSRIAQIWSGILGIEVEPHQVTLLFITAKALRASKNAGHTDSWVDIAGYAALGGEIGDRQ